MLRAVAIVIVGFLAVTNGQAEQQPVQPVRTATSVGNADLVSMTTAKLSDDVIVGAIQQATTAAFDTSPAELIALKNAGVSDRVIQAMQARALLTTSSPSSSTRVADVGSPAIKATSASPCRIFITEEEPPSSSYQVIRKEVQVGKKYYGSHDDDLMKALAKETDKAGADAVIKFHEWRAPSKWSWAAAKAGGMAVKWTTEGKSAVASLKGQCWDANGPVPQ